MKKKLLIIILNYLKNGKIREIEIAKYNETNETKDCKGIAFPGRSLVIRL